MKRELKAVSVSTGTETIAGLVTEEKKLLEEGDSHDFDLASTRTQKAGLWPTQGGMLTRKHLHMVRIFK